MFLNVSGPTTEPIATPMVTSAVTRKGALTVTALPKIERIATAVTAPDSAPPGMRNQENSAPPATPVARVRASSGQEYVAQTSVKAAGVVILTFAATSAAAAAMLSAPNTVPNLFIRITQTGGNSATGAATLVASFDLV